MGNHHPFNEVYDKYRKMSPFSNIPKEKADTSIVLAIEKVLYRILPRAIFIKIFIIAHEMMLRSAENDARAMKESVNV